MNYYEKYIKYKNKYNKMKKQIGGAKLKVGDKAMHNITKIIGIIINIYKENKIEYASIKKDINKQFKTYPLSEFTKINKFKIGDIVKRTRRTISGSGGEAIGLTGTVIDIGKEYSGETTYNKNIILLMYTIQFDVIGIGKINLNIIEDDLDLVVPSAISLPSLKISSSPEVSSPLEPSSPLEISSPLANFTPI